MIRPDRDQRVARLRAAAARKSQTAVARAEAGIRRLLRAGEPGVVAVLRARLQDAGDRERELRARVRDLEQQLAIAHGEILTLGRAKTRQRYGEQLSDHAGGPD